MRQALEDDGPTCMPGLADVLHGIVYKSFSDRSDADQYWETRTDEKARHHYLEIDGVRLKGGDGTSPYVQEHIDAFFEHVFPDLQAFWKADTFKNLMIICPYREAVSYIGLDPSSSSLTPRLQMKRYRAKIELLRRQDNLPRSWYPDVEELPADATTTTTSSSSSSSGRGTPPTAIRKLNPESAYTKCHTIDSSQGQEAFMVVIDGSWQHCDGIGKHISSSTRPAHRNLPLTNFFSFTGFMNNRGRCNVAMTRAKGVLWILGGSLRPSRPHRTREIDTPFPKLKRQMERLGRVHRLPPPGSRSGIRAEPVCEAQGSGAGVSESVRPRL